MADDEDLLLEYSPTVSDDGDRPDDDDDPKPQGLRQSSVSEKCQYTWMLIKRNRWGLSALILQCISLFIIRFSNNDDNLSLTQIDVSDYVFDPCLSSEGIKTVCPAHRHKFWALFSYHQLVIHPYGQNQWAYFPYSLCLEIPIPSFPANYQRHCNLYSAGLGCHISLQMSHYFLIISLLHMIIVMYGVNPWSKYHKLVWVTCLVSTMLIGLSYAIWALLGHLDILIHRDDHSEVFGDASLDIRHGMKLWLVLLCFWDQCLATYSSLVYIEQLKLPQLKYELNEELLLYQMELEKEDEDFALTKADLGYLQYRER